MTSRDLRTPRYSPPLAIQELEDDFKQRLSIPHVDPYLDHEKWMTVCHLWTGKPDSSGVFYIRAGGVRIEVRRYAWLLKIGAIPDGFYPRPLDECNPMCVRHSHMTLRPRRSAKLVITPKLKQDLSYFRYEHQPQWPVSELARVFGIGERRVYDLTYDRHRAA